MCQTEMNNQRISYPAKNVSNSRNRTRPLGSVCLSLAGSDNIPKFPPLTSREMPNLDGIIQGNAMSIPPKDISEKCEKKQVPIPRVLTARSEMSTGSVKSEPEMVNSRELKESLAREKQLKKQIMSLNLIIEELRNEIRERDKAIFNLQSEMTKLELKWQAMYEKETKSHNVTLKGLEETKCELRELAAQMDVLEQDHETVLTKLKLDYEERIQDVVQEKNKEIADKDAKLNRLKKQIADTLQGNSWERQQQLDELTKELTKVQEEADSLRIKIRAVARTSTTGECTNCGEMLIQLNAARKANKEKDKSLQELQITCAKFEKQLSQQDTLKHYAKKGNKVSILPK